MRSKTKNHPGIAARFFTRSQMTQASRYVRPPAPICGFCSQRSITRCEFPGCDVPVCARCRIRKGGGNLCRAHKGARLIQQLASPMIGDVAVFAVPSTRFKAKGPAVPSPHDRAT